jgi:hypothetical protein
VDSRSTVEGHSPKSLAREGLDREGTAKVDSSYVELFCMYNEREREKISQAPSFPLLLLWPTV